MDTALTLFAETSGALRRLVPFDAAVWQASDPATGLATAPMRAENLGEDGCDTYWDSELLAEKVHLFRDLARAPVPVAALRDGTADAPEHSATYRRFLRPRGLDDELRAVLRVDGQWWGQVSLFRERGRAAFTRREIAVAADALAPLGGRLRSLAGLRPPLPSSHGGTTIPVPPTATRTPPAAAQAPPPAARVLPAAAQVLPAAAQVLPAAAQAPPRPPGTTSSVIGPGVLLFDLTGALLSVNDAARELLAAVPEGPSSPSRFGVRVPAWVHSTAARALTDDRPQVRVRDRAGRWLVCHGSCLRDAAGLPTQSAVVVEPAKPSDIASLLAAVYGLTAREQEITGLVARGLSTAQLARHLHLSQHTVRDHVKAVLAKAGVNSRGELVAKLYTEHYRGLNPESRVRVWLD